MSLFSTFTAIRKLVRVPTPDAKPPIDEQALRNLRREMRTRRRALTEPGRRILSRKLIHKLGRSRQFRSARRIACYLPNDGEVDLLPLIARMEFFGKRCFLPVLDTLRPRRLWFAPYRPGDPLVDNRFGIPEPACPSRYRVAAWCLDLVLTPLVAFDEEGNRLGMGGGYYDRTLSFLKRRHYWKRPRLMGIAYEFQQVESLPQRTWDIPLNSVVTDTTIRHFR